MLCSSRFLVTSDFLILRSLVSGQVPQTPVVSVKSGLIFEKRLIEHEIEEHGLCPKTQQPLALDDLVEIKLEKDAKPQPSAATSIPGLLNIFHNVRILIFALFL